VAVIAHRGVHTREPENTLAAFAEALALGVDGVELDVRLTACGRLICFHDPYTRRLLGRSGRVKHLPLEQLLEEQVRHPAGRRRPVATLDEALSLLSDSVEIILDLKQETVRGTPLEAETVASLRRHGLSDSVVLSSFNPWVLKRARQIAPEFRTALIAGTRLGLSLFQPAYCDTLHVTHSLLASRAVESLGRKARVVVWTVDRQGLLPRPIPDFVRGIITNRPRHWLAVRGASRASGHLARSRDPR
jgi:glycerophosphoryl diester phosphodiesterase